MNNTTVYVGMDAHKEQNMVIHTEDISKKPALPFVA